MKMKVLSGVFGAFVFSVSMFALADESGTKSESESAKVAIPAPQLTHEERVKKAEIHEALAACLRSTTTTMEDCHKIMAGSCGASCGAGCGGGSGCGTCGGDSMKGAGSCGSSCAHHAGGSESCPMKDQHKPKKRGK